MTIQEKNKATEGSVTVGDMAFFNLAGLFLNLYGYFGTECVNTYHSGNMSCEHIYYPCGIRTSQGWQVSEGVIPFLPYEGPALHH